ESERFGAFRAFFLEIEGADDPVQLARSAGKLKFLAELILRIVGCISKCIVRRSVEIAAVTGLRFPVSGDGFQRHIAKLIVYRAIDAAAAIIILWVLDIGIAVR